MIEAIEVVEHGTGMRHLVPVSIIQCIEELAGGTTKIHFSSAPLWIITDTKYDEFLRYFKSPAISSNSLG